MATNLLKSIDDALELYGKVTGRRNQQLIEKTVEKLKRVKERLQDPNIINDIKNASVDASRTKAFPDRDENYRGVGRVKERVGEDGAVPAYEIGSFGLRSAPDVRGGLKDYDAPVRVPYKWTPEELTKAAYPDSENPWGYLEPVEIADDNGFTVRGGIQKNDKLLVRNPIDGNWQWIDYIQIRRLANGDAGGLETLLERSGELGEKFKSDFESGKYLLTGNVLDGFQFAENPGTSEPISEEYRRSRYLTAPGVRLTTKTTYPYGYYKSSYPEGWSKNKSLNGSGTPEEQQYFEWDMKESDYPAPIYKENEYFIKNGGLTPRDFYVGKDFDTK